MTCLLSDTVSLTLATYPLPLLDYIRCRVQLPVAAPPGRLAGPFQGQGAGLLQSFCS